MSPPDQLPPEVAIIGAGPAGLAAAATFIRAGIRVIVLEQGAIAWHVAQYPTFMRFFSTRENLEIDSFPLACADDKPTRAEYIAYLARFARYHGIEVRTHVRVVGVERLAGEGFRLRLDRHGNPLPDICVPAVVCAVGAWDRPRRLSCPGADLPKVRYRFSEGHEYAGTRVLVVGGRNGAIETALTLWRAGALVTVSYRGAEFDAKEIKYWLRPDIENRIKKKEIAAYYSSTVARVDWGTVTLDVAGGEPVTFENDFVIPMLGYDPPVELLHRFGIPTEPGTNRPTCDPATLETPTPGLFACGVIVAGNISGKIFIENSRHHGEMILPRLQEILAARLAT